MVKKKKEKSQARKKKNKDGSSEMNDKVQQQLVRSKSNSGESSAQGQVVNSTPESGTVHSAIKASCNIEPDKSIPQESKEVGSTDNGISESSSNGGSAGWRDGLTMQGVAPGTKPTAPSASSGVQLPGGSGASSHVSRVKKKKKKKRYRSRSRKRSLESCVGSNHPSGSKNFRKTKGSSASRRRSIIQMEFAKLTARAMLMALSHSPLTTDGGRRRDLPVHSHTPTERTQPTDVSFSTKERAALPRTVTDRSKYPVKKKNIDKGRRKKVVSSENKEPDQSERPSHSGAFSTKDRNGGFGNHGNKHVYAVKKGEVHVCERKNSGKDVTKASHTHTALSSDETSSSSESSSEEESCLEEELSLTKSSAQTKLSDAGKQKKVLKMPSSVAASHMNGENPSAKGKHPANGKQGKVKKSKKPGTDKCGKKKQYKIKTRYVTPKDVASNSEATKKTRKKLEADVSKTECRSVKLETPQEGTNIRSPQTFGNTYTSRLVSLMTLSRLAQENGTVSSAEHKKRRKKTANEKETTLFGPGGNSCLEKQSKVQNSSAGIKTDSPKVHQLGKKNKVRGKQRTTTSHTRDLEPSNILETLANGNPSSMESEEADKATDQSTVADSAVSSGREGKSGGSLQSGASRSRDKEKYGVSKKKISKKQGTSIKKKVEGVGKQTVASSSQTETESPDSLKCTQVQTPSISGKDVLNTLTKDKTILETVKHASSSQVNFEAVFTDTRPGETGEITSDVPKSNTQDTGKPTSSSVGTKKPPYHTGTLKPHITDSTRKPFPNVEGTPVPDSTGTVKVTPSNAITSNMMSNVTAREDYFGIVDTNRPMLNKDHVSPGPTCSNADIDSSIVTTTGNTQLMNSTGTDGHSQSSKDTQRSALVTAGIQGTVSDTNNSITAGTTGKGGNRFDETESDISLATDKDDSCIIIIDTPEKQEESSPPQEPTTSLGSLSTCVSSDESSTPGTAAKTSKNPHCPKELSVQLTRLEDEVMLHLVNKTTKSTKTYEEKSIAKTRATQEIQDRGKLVEGDKAGTEGGILQDRKTSGEKCTSEDNRIEKGTVPQLSQQESCHHSGIAGTDHNRGGVDRHTGTSKPKRERSPNSNPETLLVVSTSNAIEESCPHLPQNSCPQCLSGSEQEHAEEKFSKSNKTCSEAANIKPTQNKNTASGNDTLPSGKIGDVSYTLDEAGVKEQPGNTDKSKDNTSHGINSTSSCKPTGQDSIRQGLQTDDDMLTKDSELKHETLTAGNQQDKPCQEKRERRANLEEAIQRVWEKCRIKSQTSTVTGIGTMEIPEKEPRVSFHNKDEADDATPDPNCSATFTHTDAVVSSSKSPAQSGVDQNGVEHDSNSMFTEDSNEKVDTQCVRPCPTATNVFMETDESQPSRTTPLEQTAIEAEEDQVCINGLEESLFSMQSQESVEMFANMFVSAMYGEGEPGHKSALPWEMYTSSSDSEDSTGSDISSVEESTGSEESEQENDCNVCDNSEEYSSKENDPIATADFQTASDFDDNPEDTVVTKNSASSWDATVPGKDKNVEAEISNHHTGQPSNVVASFSKDSYSNNASPHTSQPTETNDDLVLNAVSDLEDAESDGESSTYSFIPGDHSQGPEVPDDVEEYLESVDISPIIGSANAVGGTVDQKKTCRRSLFEYQRDYEKTGGLEVKSKVDIQEDVNEDFHLALDTSAEDWSPPIKSLVADYSSPGDLELAGQHEEAGEVFKPFSQDAEGDQLLSAYMSGIEPILQDHFEPTCEKDVPPKQNNQVSDDLSRDVGIQTSQPTDRESPQIQSPFVKQTEEQEQQRQVMIRKTPAGNILQSSRYTSSTPSGQGSEKAAGKGGTPNEGKNENLERETGKDGVRQEALLAEPGHPNKPTTSAPAGVQQTSITGLQHGQRKRRAHPGPSYSSPQKLLPSKKRQAKEEAIQKLTTKGRKEQKSSSSFPTTVERAKQNDHSYSKTSKQKKIEAEGWSGVQKKQQTVKDGQRAQSLLMNKIQQLSGSRLVLPTSIASSHAKSVEGRPKKKYLVAIEKGPNTLPSGKNMDKKILENGHIDTTHTRDVHQAKQRAKKTARMCAPCPVSRGASEALVVEETDTLSATQDIDTMDTVIPPTQIDDTMKKKYIVSPRGAQGKEKTSVSKARQEGHVETQDKQTTENDTVAAVQGQIEEIQVVQNQRPSDSEHPKGAAGKRPSQESAERGEAGNKKKARTGTSEKAELELFHMENTRGMYGWEDSLRQRPSPVKRFQPEAPPTADDKGKKRKKDEQSGAVKKKAKPQMQPLVFTTIRNNPATSSKGNLAGPKDPPAASASTSSAAVLAPVSPGDIRTNSFPENGSPTDSGQEEQLPQEYKEGKYMMGELVFGKLKGYTWWPGRVVSCVETGRDPAPEGSCWVRWFGDGKFSIVQVEDKLEPFGKFSQLYHERTYNRLQTYKRAILESLQVAADRAKKKFLSSPDTHKNQDRDRTMVQWALQEFPPGGPDSLKPSAEEAKPPDHLVHQWLQARHLKQLEQVAAASSEGASSEVRRKSVDSRLERAKLFEDVRKRQLSVDQLCLACGSLDVETQHPLFRGGLCEGCRIEFLESSYQFDEDGYQSYCSLCAAGTEVLMCGQDSCCRSFCKDCLDLIVGPGTADQAVLEDPWMCYMCREEPRHGLLHRQQDWSARLQQFFAMDDVQDFGEPKLYPPVPAQQRRPIRVLSLFDGIGTALLVLKDLGVTVDVCYASEIDPDAIKVSQLRHAGGIRHLGDIRTIRNTDIPKLGPFDLVLGGSPCNDLSIANPNRAGLYAGTGVMFFHFYRLLQHAAPAPGDERPFFWLFENVVAMKHQYKQDISLFLGCNPVVVDAKDVSPAHRARYFWGNLPGMNRPLVPQASDKLALEQCLEKGCGRVAQVKKVRTVTTTLHSVRNQGKQQAAPVLMEGQPDTLWCTELERVFGFPSHYTDVCNMSRCSRQRLLGRAWSIPVIRHLLAPLKDYFQCQDKE